MTKGLPSTMSWVTVPRLSRCGADVSCAVAAMGVRARKVSVASARRLCRIVCGNYAHEEQGLSAVTSGEGCAGAASHRVRLRLYALARRLPTIPRPAD